MPFLNVYRKKQEEIDRQYIAAHPEIYERTPSQPSNPSQPVANDPILSAVVKKQNEAVKQERKPIANIKAFGADSTGAEKAGLAVGAGIKQAAASTPNLLGAFTPSTLTIGQEARVGRENGYTEAARQQAADEKRQTVQNTMYRAADRLADSAATDIAEAKEGAGKLGSFLVDLGVSGTQLVGDVLMNTVAPGTGLWNMGLRVFGNSAQEARRNGATENQQFAYAAANTAVEVLTEKLFGGVISGEKGLIAQGLERTAGGRALLNVLRNGAGKLVNDTVGEVAQRAGGQIAGKALRDFTGEAFEEVVAGVVEPLLNGIYNSKGIRENWSEIEWQQVLKEGLAGGILGMIGGGFGNVANGEQTDAWRSVQNGAGATLAERTAQSAGNLTPAQENAPTGQETANTGIANLSENPTRSTGDNAGTVEANRYNSERVDETAKNDSLGSARSGFDPLTQAELRYGTQDGGVNAVRPDDMPVSTNGRNRVSATAVSAKGAAVTPEDFVPLIEGSVMDTTTPTGLRFMPITNDETVEAAEQKIMADGWEVALKNWQKDNSAGKVSAEHTALGALLYNNAVNSGNDALALEILSDYAASNRLSARALQAARILKNLTPDGRLYLIRRSIEKLTQDMQLPNGVTLSDEVQNEYRNAKTDEEANAALDKMADEIAAQLNSTFADKVNALRYTNMLGNFKTQVRNIVGNAVMQVLSKTKDEIAAGLELMLPKEKRTKSFAADRDLVKFGRADFADIEALALGEAKYSIDEGKVAPANDVILNAMKKRTVFKFGDDALTRALGIQGKQGPVGKVMEAYRKATNWAMEKGDSVFSKSSYARALAGWLKAKGITAENVNDPAWVKKNEDLLNDGRMYAIREAQEATFRDSNDFSDAISKLARGSTNNKFIRFFGKTLDGLLPFRRTPANVAVRAEEYSPIGVLNTIYNAVQAANPNSEITGADVINQAAKALTGTGLFVLGMILRQSGRLRGGDDEDDKQQTFDDLTGHQPYSLELPNGISYTLDWVTPAAMPLFVGVAFEDARQENGVELKDIESTLMRIADPMLEMSLLSSVNDLTQENKYGKTNLLQIFATLGVSYLTQIFTNTLIGQLERTAEDERMSTYTDKNSPLPTWLQRQIGKASAKIPGWDYQQRPYVDAWGQREHGTSFLESFLSPGYVSRVDIDAMEQELQRLADATGKTNVFPATAPTSFTVDSEEVYLTGEDYVKFATTLGQTRAKILQSLTKLGGYKKMTDEDKAMAVSCAYSYAMAQAKSSVSKYKPDGWIAKAKANPLLPVQDYIVNYVTYGGTDGVEKYEKTEQAAKQYGVSTDAMTKLKDTEKATDDNGRWKKVELQDYIERNFPRDQWSDAFNAYKAISNLNWKNPY